MKKSKIKGLGFALLLSIALLGSYACNVLAASVAMVVSPPNQRIILHPGEKYQGSLTVFNPNDSTEDLKYSVQVGSFSESGEEGGKDDYGSVNHINVTSYNQIMEWISFDKEGGIVPPNTRDVVNYTIDVPENAPAGGQYATILIIDNTGDDDESGDGNVMIKSKYQFASIIYAEVAGETKQVGSISSNSIPSFSFSAPLTAESMVRNDGNVHTDAEYIFQVWPMFSDEEYCTNEDEPETSLILPESERYHTQSCDSLPSFGLFRAKQTVRIFGEESIVEKTVFICPMWLLFVIILAIIFIIIWIIVKSRSRKKD